MPVLSPRRSSTSTSGSLYGTTTSTVASSSSSAGSYSSSASPYLNRASSLSKTLSAPSSTYSPSYSSYLSSYSTYSPRSSTGRTIAPSWYLSGGSAGLGTYRSTSSYLGVGSNDSNTSSRYGLVTKPKVFDTLKKKKDDKKISNSNEAKKPPSGSEASKRLSGSFSSSSLARLVATSGLDMYEKYSPANYRPNSELSRSRSALTEADVTSASSALAAGVETDNTPSRNDTTTNVTLDRPKMRYSRLHSDGSDNDSKNESADSSRSHRLDYRGSGAKLVNSSSATSVISNSSSCGEVPMTTFTLRNNCLLRLDDEDAVLKNGVVDHSGAGGNDGSNGSVEAIATTHIQLKELKLSSSGSSLNAECKGINAITSSNSSSNVRSNNNRNKSNITKSNSSADVGDQGVADASANVTKSISGDISTNTTLKLVDVPTSAKKMNFSRSHHCL